MILRGLATIAALSGLVCAAVALVVPWATMDYYGTAIGFEATELAVDEGGPTARYSWWDDDFDRREEVDPLRFGGGLMIAFVALAGGTALGTQFSLLGHRFGAWLALAAGVPAAIVGGRATYILAVGFWDYRIAMFNGFADDGYPIVWQAGLNLAIVAAALALLAAGFALPAALRGKAGASPFPAEIGPN